MPGQISSIFRFEKSEDDPSDLKTMGYTIETKGAILRSGKCIFYKAKYWPDTNEVFVYVHFPNAQNIENLPYPPVLDMEEAREPVIELINSHHDTRRRVIPETGLHILQDRKEHGPAFVARESGSSI